MDKNYVVKNLKSETVTIVDARATRFYDGDPTGNPRDGHIAGAKNIPYMDMVDQANMFKPTDQLQTYFNPVVPDKKTEIVAITNAITIDVLLSSLITTHVTGANPKM